MVEFLFFKFSWETVNQGLEVMLFGLLGVFAVLILFYLVTKGLFVIADKLPKSKEE